MKLRDLRDQLKGRDRHIDQLASQLHQERQELLNLTRVMKHRAIEFEDLQKESATLINENDELDRENFQLEREVRDLEHQMDELQRDNEGLENFTERLEEPIDDQIVTIGAHQTEILSLQEANEDLRMKVANAEAKYQEELTHRDTLNLGFAEQILALSEDMKDFRRLRFIRDLNLEKEREKKKQNK